jgi:hypothetical protein
MQPAVVHPRVILKALGYPRIGGASASPFDADAEAVAASRFLDDTDPCADPWPETPKGCAVLSPESTPRDPRWWLCADTEEVDRIRAAVAMGIAQLSCSCAAHFPGATMMNTPTAVITAACRDLLSTVATTPVGVCPVTGRAFSVAVLCGNDARSRAGIHAIPMPRIADILINPGTATASMYRRRSREDVTASACPSVVTGMGTVVSEPRPRELPMVDQLCDLLVVYALTPEGSRHAAMSAVSKLGSTGPLLRVDTWSVSTPSLVTALLDSPKNLVRALRQLPCRRYIDALRGAVARFCVAYHYRTGGVLVEPFIPCDHVLTCFATVCTGTTSVQCTPRSSVTTLGVPLCGPVFVSEYGAPRAPGAPGTEVPAAGVYNFLAALEQPLVADVLLDIIGVPWSPRRVADLLPRSAVPGSGPEPVPRAGAGAGAGIADLPALVPGSPQTHGTWVRPQAPADTTASSSVQPGATPRVVTRPLKRQREAGGAPSVAPSYVSADVAAVSLLTPFGALVWAPGAVASVASRLVLHQVGKRYHAHPGPWLFQLMTTHIAPGEGNAATSPLFVERAEENKFSRTQMCKELRRGLGATQVSNTRGLDAGLALSPTSDTANARVCARGVCMNPLHCRATTTEAILCAVRHLMCVGELRVPQELAVDIDTAAVDSGVDATSITEAAFEETIGTKFSADDITTVLGLTGDEAVSVLHTTERIEMTMAFIAATQLFLAAVGTALCGRV